MTARATWEEHPCNQLRFRRRSTNSRYRSPRTTRGTGRSRWSGAHSAGRRRSRCAEKIGLARIEGELLHSSQDGLACWRAFRASRRSSAFSLSLASVYQDVIMTTKQTPINSGYGATTTAREVLGNRRLDGMTVVVTGGYAGVGLETTRALSEVGATVIVPARTPDKARAALAGMDRVEVESLDLFIPESIDAFAARFLASDRALNILINNAGIMAAPLARNARGIESQLATNHLGHFQLTARLWPALRKARGARVVALSSRGHRIAAFDFDDPNFERRPYDKWIAYGQSKTANALFALALDARGEPDGIR